MDTEMLKNFIILAESDSISQAARKLFMAQSALSNRLKALEKECGATLIERDYHNYKLTASGRELYERAMKIVELADSTIEELRAAESGLSGTLNLAVTPSLATGILRNFLRRYREAYPGVTVRLYEGATPYLLARLDEGLCDAALVRTPYTVSASYTAQTVYRDKMTVLASEKLPSGLELKDLLKFPLILTHRYTSMLERISAREGLKLNAPVQCEEIATCVALAETGLGATMIPQSTYSNYAAHGSKLHAAALIGEECDTACELVFLKSRRLSAATRNFANIVRDSV